MTSLMSRPTKPSKARREAARRPTRSVKPARAPRQLRSLRPGDPEETLALASSALGVLAIACLWVLMQTLLFGSIAHDRSQHLLYGELRGQLAAATAPTGALDFEGKPLEPGSPVALLTAANAGIDEVVVSGTASGDLLAGPGHLRSTVLPGQAGVSVVFGRAATYGAPFKPIASLQAGDLIRVQNAQGQVDYHVTGVRRAGDPVPAAPTGAAGGLLTLVSAEGEGTLGSLRPHEAVYVDATTDQALPAGVVAGAVPSSEQAMARDTAALPVLVLLLAGLIAVVLAVSVARRRFNGALVWLFATPVVIALAWSVTDQVMRLLPNLM